MMQVISTEQIWKMWDNGYTAVSIKTQLSYFAPQKKNIINFYIRRVIKKNAFNFESIYHAHPARENRFHSFAVNHILYINL